MLTAIEDLFCGDALKGMAWNVDGAMGENMRRAHDKYVSSAPDLSRIARNALIAKLYDSFVSRGQITSNKSCL